MAPYGRPSQHIVAHRESGAGRSANGYQSWDALEGPEEGLNGR